jgi:hypothetical protein
VGASKAVDEAVIPLQKNPNGMNTGIALHNTTDDPLRLRFELRDRGGDHLEVWTTMIEEFPPRSHMAKFVSELFPALADQSFEGSLTIRSFGGEFAATALELGSEPGEFTTLPVSPLYHAPECTTFLMEWVHQPDGSTDMTSGTTSGMTLLADCTEGGLERKNGGFLFSTEELNGGFGDLYVIDCLTGQNCGDVEFCYSIWANNGNGGNYDLGMTDFEEMSEVPESTEVLYNKHAVEARLGHSYANLSKEREKYTKFRFLKITPGVVE